MTKITDINNLEKILKTFLIEQSELEEQFVRNSLSTFGAMLNQKIETVEPSDIFDSIDPYDLVLLFELTPNNTSENVSESEIDDSISLYQSYKVHIIIYGDDSKNLATTLISRIRTEDVRSELYDLGIYLEEVTEMNSSDEYKAKTMWLRADFDIHIACQMSISPVITHNSFEELNTITITNL